VATITGTPGLQVEQYDDGKEPGTHDLSIMTADGGSGAGGEAAADPDSIQLWKLVNGRDERWIVPALAGGWLLHLEPTTRAKGLLEELSALLRQLEGQGVTEMARCFQNFWGPRATALPSPGHVAATWC